MIICADDFGLAENINQAITDLAVLHRLTAVSCLVTAPYCTPEAIAALRWCAPDVEIGLHLAFTEVPFVLPHQRIRSLVRTTHTYGSLLRRSLFRRLDAAEAEQEIRAQYDRFVDLVGTAPVFIDGHHHVHQLPGIREALLNFLQSLPSRARLYVRNTYIPLSRILRQGIAVLKNVFLSLPGKVMKRELLRLGIKTNDEFTGIYNFRHTARYAGYLERFIRAVRLPTGLVMVHPGLKEEWRRREYEALRATTSLNADGRPKMLVRS